MSKDIFNKVNSKVELSELFHRLHPSHFRQSGNCLCPFHPDRNNSLKIYQDHFHCFGCGAHGDIVHLYALTFNLKEGDAALKLADDYNLEVSSPFRVDEPDLEVEKPWTSAPAEEEPEEALNFEDRYAHLVGRPLHEGAYIHLQQRGFSKEFIDRVHEDYGIAWSRRLKRLVFPIEDANRTKLVGLQTISLKKKDRQRKKDKVFSGGTSLATGFYFYGEPTARYVVVTEGILDGLSCAQALPECAVVSILSATCTEKLKAFQDLTVFLDNDKGGREGTQKILNMKRNFKFVDWNDLEEKDANDFLKAGKISELRNLILKACLPTDEFRRRLESKIRKDKGIDWELTQNTIASHPFPVCEQTEEPDCLCELSEAETGVDEALEVPGNKIVEATAGVGKTKQAVEKAWKKVEKGELILYCQPNHKLIDSTIDRFISDPAKVIHFYGRAAMQNKYSPTVCPNAKKLRSAEQLGLSAGMTICANCWYEKEHGKKCRYAQQIRRIKEMSSGIIFAATDGFEYLLEINENITELVLDEVSTKVMIKEVSVTQGAFGELEAYLDDHPEFLEMAQALRSLINRTKGLMKETRKSAARFYNTRPGAATWHDKKLIWECLKTTQEEFKEKVTPALDTVYSLEQSQLLEMNINLEAINWLAAFAGSHHAPNQLAWIAIDSKKAENNVLFSRVVRAKLPKRQKPYSITILDATCDCDELKILYERDFSHTKVEVPWEGERIWIKHRGVGKESMGKMSEAKIKQYAKLACDHLRPDVTTAFIVTHKIAEKAVLKVFKKLRPDVHWMIDHYYATRGKNDYQAAQAVICFGVPVINPSAQIDIAGSLFPGDIERQNQWLQRQNENELYQSAHRGRMVRNPGRQLIVIGHYFPERLLGKIERTIELGRLDSKVEQAADRFLSYADKIGVFSKEVAAALRICEASNEDKARKIHEPACRSLGFEVSEKEWIVSTDSKFWIEVLTAIKTRRSDFMDCSIRLLKWDKRNYTKAIATESAMSELREFGIEVKK